MIILPRQARDKHRENSQKEWRFPRSPDGAMLAVGSADGGVSLLLVENPRPLLADARPRVMSVGKKIAHSDEITALAWKPDGSQLALGSDDTSVCVYDTTAWSLLAQIDVDEIGTSIMCLGWDRLALGLGQLVVGSSDGVVNMLTCSSSSSSSSGGGGDSWSVMGSQDCVHHSSGGSGGGSFASSDSAIAVATAGGGGGRAAQLDVDAVHDGVRMSLEWDAHGGGCSFAIEAGYVSNLLRSIEDAVAQQQQQQQQQQRLSTPPEVGLGTGAAADHTSTNRQFLDPADDEHWSDQPVQEWLDSNRKFRPDKLRSRTDHVEKIVEVLHAAAIQTVGDLVAHAKKDPKLSTLKLSSKTGGEKRAWLRELVAAQIKDSPRIVLSPASRHWKRAGAAALLAGQFAAAGGGGGGGGGGAGGGDGGVTRRLELDAAALGPIDR
jgi:hypothetical protein